VSGVQVKVPPIAVVVIVLTNARELSRFWLTYGPGPTWTRSMVAAMLS